MSEQGLPASASSSFRGNISQPTNHTPSESDIVRYKSLKRSLPETQVNLSSIANASLRASPPPKSPRLTGGFSPIRLTGAAALADQRRQKEAQSSQDGRPMSSENPGHKALSSLLSADGGANMSKPQDAPVLTPSISKPLSSIANTLLIPPTTVTTDDKPETSPASVTILASLGSTAPTATASSTATVSPAALAGHSDHDSRDHRSGISQQARMDSAKALSYPGNMLSQQPETSKAMSQARNMSLPMSGLNQQIAPRSPSQKKHKCPYCETEFTRHHNLKSHLLTHSQEKPYVCQTCTMRFRRLHDLKRHTKLHTGERPHICPKCDRKFARGDALARHSKGQGGCAGRRASMGSFGGDDDYDGPHTGDGGDDGMDGVMYTDGEHTEEPLSEEDRRFSLPSIKAQHVGSHAGSSHDNYNHLNRAPSTYPPAGPRPNGPPSGGLYPPSSDRMGSSSAGTSPSMPHSIVSAHTPNTSVSSIPLSAGSTGSMFGQSTMTESPKPLSPSGQHSHQLGHHDPNAPINRQRSPSLTTQFQQQQFGRRQSGRNSPPSNLSLPSPHAVTHGPKLPSLSGLAPPEPRYTLPSQASAQQHATNGALPGPPGQQIQPSGINAAVYHHRHPDARVGPSSQPHHQGGGSGDSSNNIFASGDRGVWTYIQDLEAKVKQMSEEILGMKHTERIQEDKINRLENEVSSLRQQVNSQHGSGSSGGAGGH